MAITNTTLANASWASSFTNNIVTVDVGKLPYITSTVNYHYRYASTQTDKFKTRYKYKYSSKYSTDLVSYRFRFLGNTVLTKVTSRYTLKYRSENVINNRLSYNFLFESQLPLNDDYKLFYKLVYSTVGTSSTTRRYKYKYTTAQPSNNVQKYTYNFTSVASVNSYINCFIIDDGVSNNLYIELFQKIPEAWKIQVLNPVRYMLTELTDNLLPQYVDTTDLNLRASNTVQDYNYVGSFTIPSVDISNYLSLQLKNSIDAIVYYKTTTIGSLSTLTEYDTNIYQLNNAPTTNITTTNRLDLTFSNDQVCCFNNTYIGTICSPY